MSLVEQAVTVCNTIRPIQTNGWPIFRLDCPDDAIFYTPGYLGLVNLPDAEQFEMMLASPEDDFKQPTLAKLRDTLVHKAEAAVAARRRWQTAPFSPECLTLYLTNQCNLACSYCYADAGPHTTQKLDMKTIRAAAKLVAQSCREKNCAFTTVFHGGGEPTLDRDFAEQVLTMLDEISQAYQVPIFRYIATNGAMSRAKAMWLARHFDLVGLSCDGPPDIQNDQRPNWSGGGTSHLVEQTAQILHQQDCRFQVRVTLTKKSLPRLVEIVDYLGRQLSPAAIHLEPLYQGGRAGETINFKTEDAPDFVALFLQARTRAAQYNVPVAYAGSRLDAIHGPYCQIFRDVLNLIPGGAATACFKITTATQASQNQLAIGSLHRALETFTINYQAIEDLRRSLIATSRACSSCFNQFHCVGECPDRCLLTETNLFKPNLQGPGFRCRIQKTLAMTTLLETADMLRDRMSSNHTANGRQTDYGYTRGTSIV